jgi:hypothetical protein
VDVVSDYSEYDRLDALVDEDPIALRDEAFRLLGEVERLRADLDAAEERGYRKAIARLRDQDAWLQWAKTHDEALYEEECEMAAQYLEAEGAMP